MRHRGIVRASLLLRQCLAVALAVGLLPVLSSAAQQGESAQEGRAHRKIEELLLKAKEFDQAGKREKAEELRHKARDLKQALENRRKSRQRGEGRTAELRKILRGLERGIASLRALDRLEEAERLQEHYQVPEPPL